MRFWQRIKNTTRRRIANIQVARKLNHSGLGGHSRIYFYHISKTGGTSLNNMFLSLGGESGADVYARLATAFDNRLISGDKVFVGWNQYHIQRGNYFYAFSHWPSHTLKLPENTFTITCLRDPLKRVLSHYKMLIEAQKNPNPPIWAIERKGWMGNSFEDFLSLAPRQNVLFQLYMFSESFNVDEAHERIQQCSHWFLTEMFDEGVYSLNQKLDLSLQPIHIRKTTVKPDFPQHSLDRLREMLEPEYQLYNRLKADWQSR